MEMEHAAALSFIQQRSLAFFVLADDETEEERLADSIFADYIDEHSHAIAQITFRRHASLRLRRVQWVCC